MLNKNSILAGFLIGFILPGTAYLLFNILYKNNHLFYKPALPYLIALALNLFITRICYKKEADDTGRGVMLATFISMVLFIVFKVKLT